MRVILFSMLLLVIVLICLIISSVWFMGFLLERMVGVWHRQLEYVMETGTVPAEWTEKYDKQYVLLEKQGASPVKLERVRKKAEKSKSRKLKKLEKYMTTTKLVDHEETRMIYLRQIKNIRMSMS